MCPDFNWPPVSVAASSTANVTVVSSVLPTGAATALNQATEIADLGTISTNTGTTSTNTTGLNLTIAPKGAPSPADSLQVGVVNAGGDLIPIQLGQALSAASVPVVLASDQSPIPVTIGAFPALQNVNVADYGGTATSLGQKLSAASVPTVIASDQSSIPVTVGNFPATQPVSGTVTANQGTANATPWNMNIADYGGTATSLGSKVSAASVPVVIASDQGAVPVSGTVTVVQPTGSDLHVVVDSSAAPTGSATAALQSSVQGTVAPGTAATNSELIGAVYTSTLPTLTTGQQAAVQVDSRGRQIIVPATPVAVTVTQADIAVGTTAVRATVSGSAPAATRVALVVTPDLNSTGNFWIGSSTVTSTGSTRGILLLTGQVFIANNDAGDYWIVSDTAAQTIGIMEQS